MCCQACAWQPARVHEPDPPPSPAHAAGINRTYLSKLEKGSYPGLEIIAKLATVTKVQAAELLATPTEPRSPALPTIVV